ncbi:RNA polymerase II associated protein 2 [Entomortierella beljakovae]|nr:RNA polymerase II associated protein 2 [Entomortierella beljakovae]
MSRVPTMKDDIVVDRSPIIEQYLPKSKPKSSQTPSNASSELSSSSSSSGKQEEKLNPKQKLIQNNITLHKKYESMVLDWTLTLCDPVSEDVLGEAANRIKKSHYQEIVDERNIGDLCGYPLCSDQPRSIKGKYRISLNERKVYDISELKKYCSSTCLSASRWFESQLTEEPLYLADVEPRYLKVTRVQIVPLGMEVAEYQAQRARNNPEEVMSPTQAYKLPAHSLETVSANPPISTSSSTPDHTVDSGRRQSKSLENKYVQSLLATVPETPSFIKIVERDTQNAVPAKPQDNSDEDNDDDHDDQYDTVDGFRVPVNSKSSKAMSGIISTGKSDGESLEVKMANVTLSEDNPMEL